MDILMLTEGEKLFLALVGCYLNIVEILKQSGTLKLVLLVLQFSLSEDHHL